MNLREIESQFIIGSFDVPATDQWSIVYTIAYNIPIVSTKYDKICEEFDKYKLHLKKSKKTHQFYDHFDSNKEWDALPTSLKTEIISIKESLLKNPNAFDLFIHGTLVDDKAEKLKRLNDLKDKFPNKPMRVNKSDKWVRFTDQQERHNILIKKGKDGLKEIISKYSQYKGVEIKKDNKRLIRIKWKVSEKLFSKEDLILNPKYIRAKNLADAQGKQFKKPKHIQEKIDIPTAFISARTVKHGKVSNLFSSIGQSVFIIPLKDAYSPNILDEFGTPYFDPNMPPVEYNWDLNHQAFEGRIILSDGSKTEFIESKEKDANGDAVHSESIRLPDDPEANSFQEIFYAELMPLYMLTREYMKTSAQKYQGKYKYGYNRLLKEGFDDWVTFLRVSPADEKASIDICKTINKAIMNQNPNLFQEMELKLKKRHQRYVISGIINDRKRIKNYTLNKLDHYLKKIEKGYNLADILYDIVTEKDETILKLKTEKIDEYIDHYNDMIKAFNTKMNDTTPLIQSTIKNTKGQKSVKIAQAQKTEERKIALKVLSLKEWHYTIPNEDYNPNVELQENREIKERRKNIEFYIHDILEQYKKEETDPKSKHVKKEIIYKDTFESYNKTGNTQKLVDYYKDIISQPHKYSRPEKYVEWLEKIIPSSANLPSPENIKKNFDAIKNEIEDKTEAKEVELLKIAISIKPMNELKHNITRADLISNP